MTAKLKPLKVKAWAVKVRGGGRIPRLFTSERDAATWRDGIAKSRPINIGDYSEPFEVEIREIKR